MNSIFDQLKDWQTAISATVGFGGLIMAALVNAHLGRVRDTRLRNAESNSVAAAIYGEILLLRREISEISKQVADFEMQHKEIDTDFVSSRMLSEPKIYQALASKLGVLPTDILLGITKFHQSLKEARRSLPLLINDPKRGYSYTAGSFLEPAARAVKDVCATLQCIERRLQIAAHEDGCDLGHTEAIIEHEELQFQASRNG